MRVQEVRESLASPAVAEAREEILAARSKLHRARGEFGPSLSLAVRRDYLGHDTNSFGHANRHLAPADYLIPLEFQQPLCPLGSQGADVDKASAELRKAQASYREARLEAQTKLTRGSERASSGRKILSRRREQPHRRRAGAGIDSSAIPRRTQGSRQRRSRANGSGRRAGRAR